MSVNILKDSNFWGPGLWRYIHSLAYTYSDIDYNDLAELFRLIAKTLPCDKCAQHSTKFINDWKREHNPMFSSVDDLQTFINSWHNISSQYAGKNMAYIDFDESKNMLLKDYSRWHVSYIMRTSLPFWIAVIILAIIVYIILCQLRTYWKTYRK